jgi:AmiR/NasT family two-component response regulator
LLEALQEIPGKPRVPVVFLTARFHPRQVEEYKNWGVIGVIKNP